MCELLGVSSQEKVPCNDLLQTFFSHSTNHPDGWGLAAFYGNTAVIEKEPVSAVDSAYLKTRLTDRIKEDILLAHIRKASVGNLSYINSHPFAIRDVRDRLWTLIHNGTIFESAELEPYKSRQKGSTDSERILYYLVDQVNARQAVRQTPLSPKARFSIVDEAVRAVVPGNKVNLLIYDGELLYVHCNHRKSLYLRQEPGTLVVSTTPLTQDHWTEAPLNTVLAYRQGERVYTGIPHRFEYVKLDHDETVPISDEQ